MAIHQLRYDNAKASPKDTHNCKDVNEIARILGLIAHGHYQVALATLNLGSPCWIASDDIGEA